MSLIFILEVSGPLSAYAEGLPRISYGITTCNMLEATLQLSPLASWHKGKGPPTMAARYEPHVQILLCKFSLRKTFNKHLFYPSFLALYYNIFS